MTTDLDAHKMVLELLAGRRSGMVSRTEQRDAAAAILDALESTLAELRQERERAERWKNAYDDTVVLMGESNDALVHRLQSFKAALSRAEETIARARAAIGDANEWDGHGRADQLDNTRRILTEYGKQKEGDRD